MPSDGQNHPLRSLVALWLSKIELASKFKKRVFGDDAEEAMKFFNGPHDFQYDADYARTHKAFSTGNDPDIEIPYVTFRMTANKVAELVALYGPLLYHRNPYRMVTPRKHWVPPQSFFIPPQLASMLEQSQQAGQVMDPRLMMALQQGMQQYQQIMQGEASAKDQHEARAALLANYLNITPQTLYLKDEMRLAIDEAIIKGMGVLWTEAYTPPNSQTTLIGSFFDSVDNLVVDPDMESIKHAKWIARRCVHPVWQLEKEYNLDPGTLKSASWESLARQSEIDADLTQDQAWARKQGTTNDLVGYWKIYSRMGLGARMAGAEQGLRTALDQFGDNVFLVIAKEVPYPLNLPPKILQQAQMQDDATLVQSIQQRLEWAVPFWADDDWPMTEITFRDVPRCPWPMNMVKPALGYQMFLNWCYSFLAAKVKNTSRDFVAVLKSAAEEIKQTMLKGGDLALLEIDAGHKKIEEVIQFLQHPPMNRDILEVLNIIEGAWERATGLSEAMYGATPEKQMRSAKEAALKGDMLRLRPDDMAERVESSSTRMAKKEAMAASWLLKGPDVMPLLGQTASQVWDQLVARHDYQSIVHEYEYRLEAGSQRKPNRDAEVANTTEGVQVILPILQAYAQQSGDVGPINAFLKAWCDARQIESDAMMMKPPPAPPPDPNAVQAQQAQQEQQQSQQEHQQGMVQKHEQHQQDGAQQQQKHQQDMELAKEKHSAQIKQMREKAAAKPKPNGTK